MIRLFRAPFSTNVERVALALAHKGLPAESVWIEYSDRSEVERVSGQGLVPVIDDNGRVVTDSTAILEYLESRYPDPPLYPADRARRAEMRLFVDWFNCVWKPWPNEIEAESDPERMEQLAGEMAAALDSFESLLTGRTHLFGDDLSAADCIAYPFLKFAAFRNPADDEPLHRILDEYQQLGPSHKNLIAWIERMKQRPQV